MARVKRVVQREMPAGPDEYGSKESALTAEPDKPIVDAHFPTREKAKNAAYRVNNGEREEWPKERYFAIFAPNPDPQAEPAQDGTVADAWELLIAPRSNGIPLGWQKEVNSPGSRRGNRQRDEETKDDDEEIQPTVEEQELEPAGV